MPLEEFLLKYPELARDIQLLSTEERRRLFESWGGVCNCGGDGYS